MVALDHSGGVDTSPGPTGATLRAPDVVAASTLTAKLEACFDFYAPELSPLQREHVFAKLALLEEALDKKGQGYSGEARGGALRWRRLRLGGLPAFAEPVVVDVDKLPGQVVAIVGPAGAGKSTLAESLMLGAFRKAPTRGTFEDLAAQDTALLAVELDTAAGSWRVTQRLDGAFVKTLPADEHVFRGGAKKPGTATEFNAWAKAALPSWKLLLATQFAAQGFEGLLTMDPAPAKDLLLGLTGGEVYQRIATESAKRARDISRQVATADGSIREAQRTADTEQTEADLVKLIASDIEQTEAALSELRRRRESALAQAPTDPGADMSRAAQAARERASTARRRRDVARGQLPSPASLEHRARVRDAVEQLPNVRAAADAAHVTYQTLQARVAEARAASGDSTGRRIAGLRAGVSALGARPKGAAALADRVLNEDAAIEAQAAAAPEQIRLLEEEEAAARVTADAAQADLEAEEATAARLDADAAAARAGFAALDLGPLDTEISQRQRTLGDLRSRGGAANARLEAAQRARSRVAALVADREKLDGEQHEWLTLERAFGRAGIQALEVEALGPDLEAAANKLLADYANGRWSVEVKLSRETNDGETDTFAIRVYDHARQIWRAAKTLSPGERVLVGEACTAALTKLARMRSPNIAPTLVRDETASSSDKVDGETWVRMLRAGAELVGASKVLVVTHDVKVMRACDSAFVVKDGTLLEVAKA